MKHISLFSGIGGFDLASDWMGWQNIASCEINDFCNKVLEYYWPNAYHHKDIHNLTYDLINEKISEKYGKEWRNDDIILTGGFPCQPFSLAGKRKGTEDDRHLWPEMLRLIREIRPTWVVGENVFGITNWDGGLVFDQVQIDLESEGYQVQPFILPACAVNAPHRRDRVWFIAYRNSTGLQTTRTEQQTAGTARSSMEWTTPDTSNQGLQRSEKQRSITGIREKRNQQPAGLLQPDWKNFPTQSPICSGNDGLSSKLSGITLPKWRNESIKAMGNSIVPQVTFEIFKTIQEFQNQNL